MTSIPGSEPGVHSQSLAYAAGLVERILGQAGVGDDTRAPLADRITEVALRGYRGERQRARVRDTAPLPLDTGENCPHPVLTYTTHTGHLGYAPGVLVCRTAEIQAHCRDCGEPFRWSGVPAGRFSGHAPTCSADGTMLRIPIRPASDDPDLGLSSSTI